MRLVHLSDLHLDSRRQLAGQTRENSDGINEALANTAACIRSLAATALATGPVDLWLITGDVTDTATPTQIEERYMVELVEELARSALVVIIAGNHDVPGSGSGASSLEALKHRRAVVVVESPQILWLDTSKERLWPAPRPSTWTTAALACMPYPRRSEFVALAPEGSREERYAQASRIVAGTIQAMRVAIETSVASTAVRLLAYHGTIDGATVGVQPRTIEHDLTVPVGALADWDYVGCGHIHKMQRLAPSVYYAGSIDRCNHDEAADYKGGLDVTALRANVPGVKAIATPARRYVTLGPDDVFDGAAGDGVVYRIKGSVTPEAAVKVRKMVAELAGIGVWISTSLVIESEARSRDSQATSDELASGVLARWLSAHPEILTDLASAHESTPEAMRTAIETFSTSVTGE